MASSYPEIRLERDLSIACALDVHSTPTVFINGRKYAGFRDQAAFRMAIKLALVRNTFTGETKDD
jgi:protein-disulfide isomerase